MLSFVSLTEFLDTCTSVHLYSMYSTPIGGRATLKMLRCKSKTQFANQERNTQSAIALLNDLKGMALQQLMLRMQVFTKNNFKR